MGWDYCLDWRSEDDVFEVLLKGYESGGYKVLAHGRTREGGERCLWFALEAKTGEKLATVCLVSSRRGSVYGYKEISEDMGPYFFYVPRVVWEQIKDSPPHGRSSAEWRERVTVSP